MPSVLPDGLAVVRAVLLTEPTITRVASRQPADVTTPFIQLVRSGGEAIMPARFDASSIDVNVFAPVEAQVSTLTRLARSVLLNANNVITPFGVLLGVTEVLGIQDLPDDRTPPLTRQGFSITAYIRPLA